MTCSRNFSKKKISFFLQSFSVLQLLIFLTSITYSIGSDSLLEMWSHSLNCGTSGQLYGRVHSHYLKEAEFAPKLSGIVWDKIFTTPLLGIQRSRANPWSGALPHIPLSHIWTIALGVEGDSMLGLNQKVKLNVIYSPSY